MYNLTSRALNLLQRLHNVAARLGPFSVDQPGYSTLLNIWDQKMSTTCIILIPSGYPL